MLFKTMVLLKKKQLEIRFILAILIIFSICNTVGAKKLGVLPEIVLPGSIQIDKDQLYISDQKTGKSFLMDIKSLKHVKQLTQKGSGPSETYTWPSISIYKDYVFVYCLGKAIYFSKDGQYLKEFKVHKKTGNWLMPLGRNFILKTTIVQRNTKEYWNDFSLYSYSKETDLKLVKTLYLSKFPTQTNTGGKVNFLALKEYVSYTVYDDKLFLCDATRGLYVEIFDENGERTGKIYLPQYEKQKVTDRFKKDYLEMVNSNPYFATVKNIYHLVFPDYFPPYQYFVIDKNKLYFVTYNRKGDDREIIVVDWKKGKVLKHAYIPWIYNEGALELPIVDDKYYYVVEDENSGEWELHVANLK